MQAMWWCRSDFHLSAGSLPCWSWWCPARCLWSLPQCLCVMWSRMKALCRDCLVSKHSAGSSTHTFSHLFMLVLGLHWYRCVFYACLACRYTSLWAAEFVPDRPQYKLLTAKSSTWITTLPLQYYSMFYSPLTLPLPLALTLSALLSPWGTAGTFPRVH